MKVSLSLLLFATMANAAETGPARYPGLSELRIGTAVEALRPGAGFEVGFLFRHEPEYHTYWKAPGIVGVGATVQWELPEGFEAGDIRWPAPQTTKMATWTAYGYETDTCLVIPVRAPDVITPEMLDDEGRVVLRGRVGWMACATTCHPGWHDFELRLPVAATPGEDLRVDNKWKRILADSRSRYPGPAPEGWSFEAVEIDADTIQLVARAPEGAALDGAGVYFFSHDNQVNSHEPQKVEPLEGGAGFRITLSRPDFAPENPEKLSGVLFRPDGWPGLDRPWMIVSAPW